MSESAKRIIDKTDERISVVIVAFNEESKIRNCILSVSSWADEIVLVDLQSSDNTAKIADELGAKVYSHEFVPYADPVRPFGVSKASNDWIMMLDADEMVPKSLANELQKIANENIADVVIIPWRNFLIGDEMRYSGWGFHQDRHARFFKRAMVDLGDDIHNFIKIKKEARVLKLESKKELAVIHFNYLDFEHFLEKMNRYTSIDAHDMVKRGKSISLFKGFMRSLRKFFYVYFQRAGFRDGWRGFYLSFCMFFYRILTYAKAKALKEVGNREEIQKKYDEIASHVISEYQQE